MPEDFDPNVTRAEPDWPVAVVASAFLTGVLVARSLVRRGVRVYLVDCDPTQHGFRSIYGEALRCPNPDTAPDEWSRFMIDLAARLGGRPALLAGSDQFVSVMGRYAGPLGECYRMSRTVALQAELAVKEGQIRLAQQHGLPAPLTCHAATAAAVDQFGTEAAFPVILKPRQQRYWSKAPPGHPLYMAKAVESANAAELTANYLLAAEFSAEVVVQEMIPGPDTNKRVHLAIYGRDGTRLGRLTLKELRCTRFGVPTVCEPIDDPEVDAVCDRFFRALGYHGTGEIELMWDERDGKPKMMDINPRFTGSGDAAPYAGLDHAWLVYLDLIGQPVRPVSPPPRLFRHIMLLNDMLAIRQYWRAGWLSLGGLVQSYRGQVYFWDLDWRDRRLAASTVWRVLRTGAGTVLSAVSPKR